MERRHLAATCRAAGDTGREFNGEAIVYNTETLIGSVRWGFYETIAPGAARDSIANDDIVFLDSHDPSRPLARTSVGTLRLTDGASSLSVNCPAIPATSYGNDLVENLRNGNVAGMSFGFDVLDDSWGTRSVELPDGTPMIVETRTITQLKLYEVSATAFPAYEATSAAVRAAFATRRQAPISIATYAQAVALRDRILTEWREGKTLSAATMDQLQNVLDLIAAADEAVDDAQPLLAGLMGVPNPDEDEETEDPDEGDGDDTDGNIDPNASQEGSRSTSDFYDRRLSALAALTGLPKVGRLGQP